MSFFTRRFAAQAVPVVRQRVTSASRNMGAKAGPGGIPHFHVSPYHKHTGTALATIMWLWVFYRAQQDGATVLGFVHPWDAHGHDDDDSDLHFEKEGVGAVPSTVDASEDEDEH